MDMYSSYNAETDYIITHVLSAFDGIPKGYAILSIEKFSEWEMKQVDSTDVRLTLIRINNNFLFTEQEKITF